MNKQGERLQSYKLFPLQQQQQQLVVFFILIDLTLKSPSPPMLLCSPRGHAAPRIKTTSLNRLNMCIGASV